MRLQRNLQRWVRNELIDEATADRIAAFEKKRGGLTLSNSLYGLGGLAIVLGMAAIISVNWDEIPVALKLGGHLAVNVLLAGALYHHATRTGTGAGTDLLAGALAATTLTFIALVGQAYQAQEPTWKALALWLALVTPMLVAVARTQFLVKAWIIALLVTYGAFLAARAEPWREALPDILLISLFPYVLIAVGQCRPFRAVREDFAMQIAQTGFVLLAVLASAVQFTWRESAPEMSPAHLQACVATLAASALPGLARSVGVLVRVPRALDVFMVVSAVVGFMPLVIPHGAWPVVGAGVVMVYWGFCGWTGLQAGHPRAIGFAVWLIALRLFIVYVEVFGSLLSTGIGLMVSGSLLIGLVLATRRILARVRATRGGGA